MGEGPSAPRRSILLRAVAAILALVVSLAIGIHLPPARRLVLEQLLPLAGGAGLRVDVDSLDYNLFRLRATATGVRVAATSTPGTPFFEAASVTAAALPVVLRGQFALERLEIVGGRVRILQTAGGSNLPMPASSSTSRPGPLRLGHVTADLAVDVRDEDAGYSVDFQRMSVDLAPSGGRLATGGGRIGLGDRTINVISLAGGAAFDGRVLTLQGMDLASDVATARIDGQLHLITGTTGMDLRLSGAGSVAALIALATPEHVFEGTLTFEGSVAGPFGAPVADLRVRSSRLDRDALALSDVDVTTRVDASGAEIPQATFGLAGGRVDGAVHVAFDGTRNRVQGKWAGVDVPGLLTSLVDAPPALLPAGRTSGTFTSEGVGFDLAQWTTAASLGVGPAVSARGRLAMPGQSQLRIAARAWQLDGRHTVGDVAPVSFSLNGTIQPSGRVPLGGSVELGGTDVSMLAAVLTDVGLADVPPSFLAGGTAAATATLGGDLGVPTLTGIAMFDGVRGEGFQLGPTRADFNAVVLDGDVQLDARADSAEVAGQALGRVDASARIRDGAVVVNSFRCRRIERRWKGDGIRDGTYSATGRMSFERLSLTGSWTRTRAFPQRASSM